MSNWIEGIVFALNSDEIIALDDESIFSSDLRALKFISCQRNCNSSTPENHKELRIIDTQV
jgi:hypothetical protein